MRDYVFTFEYIPFDTDDMPAEGESYLVEVDWTFGCDIDMIRESFDFTFKIDGVDYTHALSKRDANYIRQATPLEHKKNMLELETFYAD